MLRSMKAKLAGKKPAAKEESPPLPASSKSVANSTSKPLAAPPKQPVVKEKPPLPVINEQMLRQYYAEPLPSFRDLAPSEKQVLFVQKLHLCSFTFDFTEPASYMREKEIKRQTLLELVDYVNSGQGKFTEAVSEDIVFMISQNLFRALPPTRSHDVDNYDPEEEEPTLEAGWPHLQVGAGMQKRRAGALMALHRHCIVAMHAAAACRGSVQR